MFRRIFLGACGLFVSTLAADQLSDLDIYSRCYVRMVRMVPDPVNDTLYNQVKSGAVKGPAACLQLFDSAAFASTGVMTNRTSMTARRIVKTFNDFHRTWFESRVPSQISGATLLIADQEEPALYYTRALFQTGVSFNSVLTLGNGLTGVRDRIANPTVGGTFQAQRMLAYAPTLTYASSTNLIVQYQNTSLTAKGALTISIDTITVPDSQLVQVGELVGVQPTQPFIFPSFLPVTDVSVRSVVTKNLANFDANQHFGGGILGSQGFLNANSNLGINVIALDATNINRRISSRIFEDLLCEQEPMLTPSDVEAEVNPSSTYTFQQSVSCMQCHSSNDNAAYILNNIFSFVSGGPAQNTFGQRIFAMGILPPVASPTPTTPFALLPPSQTNAFLHYRENLTDTAKAAIKQPITSISDLGTKIAAGNDFYLCAAKRYYKFFTGVDVNLTAVATSPQDLAHQNFVVKLGKDLKKSQNVRSILNEILASPQFAARNYQTSEAQ